MFMWLCLCMFNLSRFITLNELTLTNTKHFDSAYWADGGENTVLGVNQLTILIVQRQTKWVIFKVINQRNSEHGHLHCVMNIQYSDIAIFQFNWLIIYILVLVLLLQIDFFKHELGNQLLLVVDFWMILLTLRVQNVWYYSHNMVWFGTFSLKGGGGFILAYIEFMVKTFILMICTHEYDSMFLNQNVLHLIQQDKCTFNTHC